MQDLLHWMFPNLQSSRLQEHWDNAPKDTQSGNFRVSVQGWMVLVVPSSAEDIPGFFIIHQSRLVCLLLSRGRRNAHLRAPSPPGVNFWGNPSLYEQGLPFLAPTGCPQVKLCRASPEFSVGGVKDLWNSLGRQRLFLHTKYKMSCLAKPPSRGGLCPLSPPLPSDLGSSSSSSAVSFVTRAARAGFGDTP